MKKVFVSFALMALFLGGVNVVSAQSSSPLIGGRTYVVLAMKNTTSSTVHYAYRWGNGDWGSISLKPGHFYWHSWDISHGGSAPSFTIRFDNDLSSGLHMRQLRLTPRLAPFKGYDFARKYYFHKSSSTLRLVTTTGG